jgi:hypothetical protein
VVQQSALRHEDGPERGEVPVELSLADVLGHADRRDRIELLAGQVAVVLQPDLDPIRHARLGDSFASEVGLGLADGDPDHPGVVMRRGVDRHGTPSTPDVEQALIGPLVQAQLATDQLVLGLLRLIEGGAVVDETGARVGHGGPQDQAVEIVADVVVVGDRPRVALHRMTPTTEASLFGRRRDGATNAADLPRGLDRIGERHQPVRALRWSGITQRRDCGEDVAVQLDVAGDVRPAESELVGHPQQTAQGVGRCEAERCHRLWPADGRPVPELERDGHVTAQEAHDQRSHRRRDSSVGWRVSRQRRG